MNRRTILGLLAFTPVGLACGTAHGDPPEWPGPREPISHAGEPTPPVGQRLVLDDAEWRRRLTRAQYDVLRREGTERAGSSPLDHEHRAGTFHCAGCGAPLFASSTKFDSGTGWPSFYTFLEGRIAERRDNSLGIERVEVHCARCDGHQGHVFRDGPRPTGLRYCINGVALEFRPA